MKRIHKTLICMNLLLAVLFAAGSIYKMDAARTVNTKSADVSAGIIEEKKKVALTFDDGPSPECTEDLLDGLAEREVKATFFLIGKKAEEYPDLVKKIQAGGHLIGNHSYTHVNLGVLSCEDACSQIQKTNRAIEEAAGVIPQYVRSPFGSTQKNLDCKMDMIEVLWDVDPRDWEIQNTEQIVNKVVTKVQENDIILLHDGYEESVAATFEIIDTLKKQGYEFVTVDELIFE